MGTVKSIRSRRAQRGAVAIVIGISIVTLVLMIGLVLDLSHLFIVKHELQNAADACALSGARELNDLGEGALERATGAAVTAGTHNLAQLQHDAVVIDGLQEVKFSDVFAGPYEHAITPGTRYVRCSPHETNPKSVAMWFMQVAGIFERSLSAEAIARRAEAGGHCAIPLAMCTDTSGSDLVVGNWYYGRTSPGGAITPGMYEWVQFEEGEAGAKKMASYLDGDGYCATPMQVHKGKGGVTSSMKGPWNTRFGLYGFGYKIADMTVNRAETTGYSFPLVPPSSNVYEQFVQHQLANDAYNGAIGGGGTKAMTSTQYHDFGVKDRRVVTVPVIRCEDVRNNKEMPPIVQWGCSLMLAPIWSDTDRVALEFLGLEGTAACAGNPTGPGTGPLLVK